VEDNNKGLGLGEGGELGGRPFVPVMAGEHRRPGLVEPGEARVRLDEPGETQR
jgi:hypothetical protein